MRVNKNTSAQKLQWLRILFILALTITFTAIYEMFWGRLFYDNYYHVSAWHDLPGAILLAFTFTTAYVVEQLDEFTKRPWVRAGLLIMALAMLIEVPAKIYLGGHESPIYLAWYPLFPLTFLGIAFIAVNLRKRISAVIFSTWNLWLLAGAVAFRVDPRMHFSGWGVVFELGLIVFMVWLLIDCVRLARQKGNLK